MPHATAQAVVAPALVKLRVSRPTQIGPSSDGESSFLLQAWGSDDSINSICGISHVTSPRFCAVAFLKCW